MSQLPLQMEDGRRPRIVARFRGIEGLRFAIFFFFCKESKKGLDRYFFIFLPMYIWFSRVGNVVFVFFFRRRTSRANFSFALAMCAEGKA